MLSVVSSVPYPISHHNNFCPGFIFCFCNICAFIYLIGQPSLILSPDFSFSVLLIVLYHPKTHHPAMPETQLPVIVSQQSQWPDTYPMVESLFDVVPLPFTQEYAAPAGTVVAPNSLRLVRKFGGTLADFPTNPHTFSIPGRLLEDAGFFVKAMQATVLWVCNKPGKKEPDEVIPATTGQPCRGRPTDFSFTLQYRCPCTGFHKAPNNSRKQIGLCKCGCKAWFSVSHHLLTNSL
jgi:hypothetical protein